MLELNSMAIRWDMALGVRSTVILTRRRFLTGLGTIGALTLGLAACGGATTPTAAPSTAPSAAPTAAASSVSSSDPHGCRCRAERCGERGTNRRRHGRDAPRASQQRRERRRDTWDARVTPYSGEARRSRRTGGDRRDEVDGDGPRAV